MTPDWHAIGKEGLQFFGKTSASISHDIKNALAIVNEHAGLLQDLALLADKGKPIELERLKAVSEKIIIQIRRANSIVASLNRLGHSIDADVKSIDLAEALGFVVLLSQRLASRHGVTLELKPAKKPITIDTNLFFLENLLWLCINYSIDAGREGGAIGLIVAGTGNGGNVTLTGLSGSSTAFPGEGVNVLLEVLEAEAFVDEAAGELVVNLPQRITADSTLKS